MPDVWKGSARPPYSVPSYIYFNRQTGGLFVSPAFKKRLKPFSGEYELTRDIVGAFLCVFTHVFARALIFKTGVVFKACAVDNCS